MADAKVTKVIELDGTVFPPCVCGKAWVAHGECGGYQPDRPIEEFNTIFFKSGDVIANMLWKLEKLISRLRKARMRSL